MTRMKLGAMILAAAAGATALGVAAEAETPPYQKTVKSGAPKTHIIMDAPPGAFEIERKVVAAVESLYGPGAVMSNGRRLPPDIEAGIAPGRPLPSARRSRSSRPSWSSACPRGMTGRASASISSRSAPTAGSRRWSTTRCRRPARPEAPPALPGPPRREGIYFF